MRMGAFLFTCPTTKLNVQHWMNGDEDVPEDEYEWIICLACARLHLINSRTGKLLGSEDE
jgi:hypothetical protein